MLSMREAVGFVLAPLPVLAPVVAGAGVVIFDQTADRPYILWSTIQLLVIGYGATFLFGLPIHLTLRRKQQTKIGAYVGLAVVSASLIGAALAIHQRLFAPVSTDNPFQIHLWGRAGLWLTVLLAIIAALTSWIFWLVAVRQQRH